MSVPVLVGMSSSLLPQASNVYLDVPNKCVHIYDSVGKLPPFIVPYQCHCRHFHFLHL